jgi:hypothetical protein
MEIMGYNQPEKNEVICANSFYVNFHFLLGKIVVNYNLIESKFIMMICELIDHNDITKGFLKCKRKGATQLLKILSDLIKEKIKNKEILENFIKLHSELDKIIEQRNIFIHSIYFDTSNMEIKLTAKITKVRRIRIREFEKGKKIIDTDIVYELTPLQALLQKLFHIDKEIDKFTRLLSKEVPMKRIVFHIPEEPEFLKYK